MKKHLLFVLSLCFALVTSAADLNPFAYDLKTLSYDANTYTLSLQYKLNAPAKTIKIYAKDSNKQRYLMKTYSSGSNEVKKGTRNITINLLECEESIPRGEYLTWEIDAISTHQTDVACGRKITLYTPFSIDIDNNPESPYFGRIVTSQANNTTAADDVGLYVYDPAFNLQGTYKDPDLSWSTNDWYSGTRLTPFRVRILQDGTGRIFTSAASYKRTTHLWIVNNNDLTDWDQVISNEEMISFTGHPSAENTLGNIGFDFKIDGNNLDILLFSGSTDGAPECPVGYVHSGVFHCTLDNPQTGTYTIITKDIAGARHLYVTSNKNTSNGPIGSFLNSNITYDQYGGIWYTHHSTSMNTTNPGLLHYINNSWKTNYADGTTLQRQHIGSGAIRYNKHFNRLAISQGSSSAVRLYDVSQQEKQHPTLSNGTNIAITSTADPKYIIDLAWDYASNLYACIRNRDSNLYGVWTIATNLKGDPTTTPAPNKNENRIFLECNDTQYNITINAQVDNNSINTNLGACALKVDNISANWGTIKSVQACEQITVTAVKDSKYKFLGWYDGSTKLSSELEYAFYASKDINLVAKFEFAEYNVVWYNLFQNNEDITDYIINPNSNMDGKVNSRLWRLFQVAFNEALKEKYPSGTLRSDQANLTINGKQNVDVANFIAGTNAQNILLDFIGVTDNTTSQLSVRPFKWLGPYIKYALAQQDIPYTESYNTHTFWRGTLYRFFNRSSKAYTKGNKEWSFGTGDFTEDGKPTHWRSWWADIACELEPKMNYNTPMPTIWDQSYTPTTSIQDAGNPTNYFIPGEWYKWNPTAEDADKLLAWRYGDSTKLPSAQTLGPIVHNAYQDGALFATWVDKHLDENDSKEDGASNEDVIKLMKNTNHTTDTESFTVTRKLVGGMYNTICMPFTLELTGLMDTHFLSGAKAYDFSGIDPLYDTGTNEPVTVLNFTEVTTLLPGKPYLIVPEADVTEDMPFTGVRRTDLTLEPQSKTVTYGDNELKITFHGVINPADIPAGALMVVADNRLAVNTVDNSTMKGMRGYFTIDFSSLAAQEVQEQALDGRVYLSFKKPVTTSVPLAPEAEQPTTPKVEKIMRDGQIYIIRDGVTYTITGARVR